MLFSASIEYTSAKFDSKISKTYGKSVIHTSALQEFRLHRRATLKNLEKDNRKLFIQVQHQASDLALKSIAQRVKFLNRKAETVKKIVEGLKYFGSQKGCASRNFDYIQLLANESNGRLMLMRCQMKIQLMESEAKFKRQIEYTRFTYLCVPRPLVVDNEDILETMRIGLASMKEQTTMLVEELDNVRKTTDKVQLDIKITTDALDKYMCNEYQENPILCSVTTMASEPAKKPKKSFFKFLKAWFTVVACLNFVIVYILWVLVKLL